jgi:hypothetical protein
MDCIGGGGRRKADVYLWSSDTDPIARFAFSVETVLLPGIASVQGRNMSLTDEEKFGFSNLHQMCLDNSTEN